MIVEDVDPSQLCIIGMNLAVIDKIWEITDVLTLLGNGAIKGDLNLSIRCAMTDSEQQIYPFTGEKTEDAYFRTLTADQWYNSERIDDDYRRLYFPLIHPILQQAFEEALDLPESFWIEIGVSFVKHVERILILRKVFLTSEGLLGLCPKGAGKGEHVCIGLAFFICSYLYHIKPLAMVTSKLRLISKNGGIDILEVVARTEMLVGVVGTRIANSDAPHGAGTLRSR